MNKQKVQILVAGAALATSIFAQNQRQASMVGGGGPDRGKCTIEVVVDGTAQVEIHGTSANLRTMAGQPAQWRRFECTGPLPANPANFRFAGVDGRGRQDLIRDPRNGGAAIVQITDKDGGSEGYTFDLFWDSRGNNEGAGGPPPPRRDDRDQGYRPGYRDSEYYRRNQRGFGTDEATKVCQQEVLNQASRRFRTNDVQFHGTRIDDNPGRNDWVNGAIEIHRGGRELRYGFACSVDFGSGRVRSAQIDQRPLPEDRWRR